LSDIFLIYVFHILRYVRLIAVASSYINEINQIASNSLNTVIIPIKVVYLEGRTFPINVRYSTEEYDDYIGASISTILALHQQLPLNDHFLVFLTGQDEIEAACRILRWD
jgi:HrpA-like RNA helicase